MSYGRITIKMDKMEPILLNALVFPVFLYGAEIWTTIKADDREMIGVFET